MIKVLYKGYLQIELPLEEKVNGKNMYKSH